MSNGLLTKLTLIALLTISTPAMARSLMPNVWNAELDKFQVDPQLSYALTIDSAQVEVNYLEKTVTLSLFRHSYCPPGSMCILSIPLPIYISLPIQSIQKDRCGVNVIIASRDQRPVDGGLSTLTLRDNSVQKCATYTSFAGTELSYDTVSSGMGGRVVRTHSEFSGGNLQPGTPVAR